MELPVVDAVVHSDLAHLRGGAGSARRGSSAHGAEGGAVSEYRSKSI